MVSAQISPGSSKHNPRNSINLSTSLIFPPKWVLFTDPCFTRYKKSLSDSQRAPSTPQHPTAKNTNTHTYTHSSMARWKHLKGQNLVDIHVFPKTYGELGVLGDVSWTTFKTLRFVGIFTLVQKNLNISGYGKISYTQQTCWLLILNYRRYFKHNLEINHMKHYSSKFP